MTVLKRMGHTDITVVPEQEQPNGDFPTCPYPNPEILEAMQLGLNLCEKLGADLLLATDPDSDRVGTAVLQNARRALSPATKWACCCWITSAGPGWSCTKCRKPRRRPQHCFHHHDRRHRGALWRGDAAGADRV